MSNPTLLAIDQGTTSTRAMLFSKSGEVLGVAQKELPQIYPHKGWIEHDANVIWQDVLSTCCGVLLQDMDAAHNCAAIGITNQRETTVIWNRKTGLPVYNAIVWQDRRTADVTDQLKTPENEKMVQEKTGLLLDPYFSCSKIKWILDHVEGARSQADAGDLCFGTIDCFLLWHLTKGRAHATDVTNAARTGLYNIVTQAWDSDLLQLYDIPPSLLPEVKDNAANFGCSAPEFFGRSLAIGGMAGDQNAAMMGQCCFEKGMLKSTYGTGCFALLNIGSEFRTSQNGLLTTAAYCLGGDMIYAIEGSIFMAGATIQWLRDNLGIITDAAESEALALSVPDNNGVYFIPAFTGLGAPHWRPEARAMISGLTRDSTKAHIARAALEAQAYQTHDLLRAMEGDTGVYPNILRVDGGLVSNEFMCQFLSDMLQTTVELPTVTETTALGAAYIAGLQVGVYQDLDDITKNWTRAKLYKPQMSASDADRLYSEWNKNLAFFLKS